MGNTIKTYDRAKELILWAASDIEIRSSYSVIERAQIRDPSVPSDDLRSAYWFLVGEGELIRTVEPSTGVIKNKL